MRSQLPVFAVLVPLCVFSGVARSETVSIAQNGAPDAGPGLQAVFYADYVVGQTFKATTTATVTNVLASVHSIYWYDQTEAQKHNPNSIPLTFNIYNTTQETVNGVQPTGPALSTGSIAWNIPGDISGSVSMTPAVLQEGTTYILTASAPGTDQAYAWYTGKTYADGYETIYWTGYGTFVRQSYDLQFQVNGVVPEPSSMVLLGVGGLAMFASGLRSRWKTRRWAIAG